MTKTLLIATLALFATVTAEPYISALSSFYGPAGPFGAAYSLTGAPLAPAVPAALPAVPAPVPAAYTAAVAPVSAYSSEFAAPFPYGGLVPNYAPVSSAYLPQSYAYAYGDYIYRR